MTNLSLVADEKIEKDPRKIAFLYPKMPVGRYKKLVDEYYRNRTLRAAEQIAKKFGSILIPASCLHHRRRNPDLRLMVLGRAYYCIQEDDLTDLEKIKYQYVCTEQAKMSCGRDI